MLVNKSDTVSFLEFIYASAGINKLLLACEERVAFRTDINLNNVNVFGRAGSKRRTASTLNGNGFIRRMNIIFHIITSLKFITLILYIKIFSKSTYFNLFNCGFFINNVKNY